MQHRPDRFMALLDANVLGPVSLRNCLLSLGQAGLYRPRWSRSILDEVEAFIASQTGDAQKALLQVHRLEAAFEESCVENWDHLVESFRIAPDENDAHVMAAAAQCGAHVIVTNNLKDFPESILSPWGIEALSADAFIADLIDLNQRVAAAALAKMRARLQRPELSPDEMLARMERAGLTETVQLLRPHLADL